MTRASLKILAPPAPVPAMTRHEELNALIGAGLGDTPGYEIRQSQFAAAVNEYRKLSPADRHAAVVVGFKASAAHGGRRKRLAA